MVRVLGFQSRSPELETTSRTGQKMRFSNKDFFIFCAVLVPWLIESLIFLIKLVPYQDLYQDLGETFWLKVNYLLLMTPQTLKRGHKAFF